MGEETGGLFCAPSRLADKLPVEERAPGNQDLTCIVSQEEMEILLNDICVGVKSPLALIQFSGNATRIDASVPTVFLRPSCTNFRLAAGTGPCEDCDRCHAELFKNLTEAEIGIKVPEGIEKNDYHSKFYTWPSEHKPSFVPKDPLQEGAASTAHGYLEYKCPILGYTEVAFPIVFEGRVLGVIMNGQISIDSSNPSASHSVKFASNPNIAPSVKSALASFAKGNKNGGGIFENYLSCAHKEREENPNISPQIPQTDTEIVDFISDSDSPYAVLLKNYPEMEIPSEKVASSRPSVLKPGEYKTLLEDIDTKLLELNRRLNELMSAKRKKFIEKTVDDCIEGFYARLKMPVITDHVGAGKGVSPNANPNRILSELWKLIEDSANRLTKEFAPVSIEIYGTKTFLLEKTERLKHIFSSREGRTAAPGEPSPVQRDISIRNMNDLVQSVSIRNGSELWEKLEAVDRAFLETDGAFLLLFPVQGLPALSVLMRVVPPPGVKDDILNALDTYLRVWGTALFSAFVAQMAVISDVSSKTTLRVYGHEIAHAAIGIDSSCKYFPDLRVSKGMQRKIDDIKADLESSSIQFSSLATNVKIILGRPVPIDKKDCDEVWIFKELLYKWNRLFRDRLDDKCLNIRIPDADSGDDLRAPYVTDRMLLEQIVYNLIDNAVKYCHWGTNIHMDCISPSEDSGSRVFTVTDYGAGIPKDDDPYGLFSRGREDVDGEGVGLYVVRRIAELLGGGVGHYSKRVSAFYVPYLQPYLDLDGGDEKTRKDVEEEIARLKNLGTEMSRDESYYPRIVSTRISKTPPKATVLRKITDPTYEVKFEVTI